MKRNYDFSKGVILKGAVKSKSQIEKLIESQQKVLTSIRLDKDIVDAAKKCAERDGVAYLTWLNKKLREVILNEETLPQRVERLERAVFKKQA